MRLFSVLYALGTRLSSSLFAQDLVLRSPPSISQCERVSVGWEGGQAPYSLEGFSNGSQIFGVSNLTAPRHNLGVVLYGATEGDIVVFRLTDDARTARYASYRVKPSEDDRCLRHLQEKLLSSTSDPGWTVLLSLPLQDQDNHLTSGDSHAQWFMYSNEGSESGLSNDHPQNMAIDDDSNSHLSTLIDDRRP